jgi:hypothetical protein
MCIRFRIKLDSLGTDITEGVCKIQPAKDVHFREHTKANHKPVQYWYGSYGTLLDEVYALRPLKGFMATNYLLTFIPTNLYK